MRNPLKRLQKKINRRLAVNQYQVTAKTQQEPQKEEQQNQAPQHKPEVNDSLTDYTVSTSTLHEDDPAVIGGSPKVPHYMIETHHLEATPPAPKQTSFLRRGQGHIASGQTTTVPLSPSSTSRHTQHPPSPSKKSPKSSGGSPVRTSRCTPLEPVASHAPTRRTDTRLEAAAVHCNNSLSPSSSSNIAPPPAAAAATTTGANKSQRDSAARIVDPPGRSPNPHNRQPPTPLKPHNRQQQVVRSSPQKQRRPQQLLDPEQEQQLKELRKRQQQREMQQQQHNSPPQPHNPLQPTPAQIPTHFQQLIDPKQQQQLTQSKELKQQPRHDDRVRSDQMKQPREQKKKRPVDPNLERIAKAATALDNSGNVFFEKGEYDKAMATYVKALKLKNRTLISAKMDELQAEKQHPQKTGNGANSAQGGVGNAHQGNFHYSIPPTAEEKSVKSGAADDIWISVATSVNNIAYLRQQSGKATADETMAAYQNSLQIKRRILGKDNLSVAKTLNNLGTVHYLKREYEPALQAYGEALQIMQASLGMSHLDVGTVHSNVGDVYWAKSGEAIHGSQQDPEACADNRAAALHHYRQALEIRWEQLKDHNDPKVIRLLEKIAALEMGESFLALMNRSAQNLENETERLMTVEEEEDEALESQDPPVTTELHNLHEEVREDVKKMDLVQRKLAIDMVKDKLRMFREMKNLAELDLTKVCSEDDHKSDINSFLDRETAPPPLNKPLSPVQRTEALSAVKERLTRLRKQRERGGQDHESGAKDLKEIDSPSTGAPVGILGFQRDKEAPHPFEPTELQRSLSNSSILSNMSTSARGTSNRANTKLEDGIDALRNFSVGDKHDEQGPSKGPSHGQSRVASMRQLFESKKPRSSAVKPSPLGIAPLASFS